MEAFLYMWFDKKFKMFYIGSHKGTENDGYVCSSKYMKYEYEQRSDDFKRMIIKYGSHEAILALEHKILTQIDAANNSLYYNISNSHEDWNLKAWLPEVAARRKATRSKRHDKIHEKIQKTNQTNLGVDYPFQSPNIQQKIHENNLKKYNARTPAGSKEFRARTIEKTNLQRFGHISPLGNADIQNKIRNTVIEKWGYKSTAQHPDTKEKARQTNLERYGVEWTGQSKELIEKRKATNRERHGGNSSTCNPEVRNRQIATRRANKDKQFEQIKKLDENSLYRWVFDNFKLYSNIEKDVIYRNDSVTKLFNKLDIDPVYGYKMLLLINIDRKEQLGMKPWQEQQPRQRKQKNSHTKN